MHVQTFNVTTGILFLALINCLLYNNSFNNIANTLIENILIHVLAIYTSSSISNGQIMSVTSTRMHVPLLQSLNMIGLSLRDKPRLQLADNLLTIWQNVGMSRERILTVCITPWKFHRAHPSAPLWANFMWSFMMIGIKGKLVIRIK